MSAEGTLLVGWDTCGHVDGVGPAGCDEPTVATVALETSLRPIRWRACEKHARLCEEQARTSASTITVTWER